MLEKKKTVEASIKRINAIVGKVDKVKEEKSKLAFQMDTIKRDMEGTRKKLFLLLGAKSFDEAERVIDTRKTKLEKEVALLEKKYSTILEKINEYGFGE